MAFIGPWEIALILVVILILFGPKKLPDLAKGLGKAIREYKKATSALEDMVEEPVKTISKPITTSTQATKEGQGVSPSGGSAPSERSAEETLILTAKQLNIETEGKSLEQRGRIFQPLVIFTRKISEENCTVFWGFSEKA